MATELVVEIARCQEIRALLYEPGAPEWNVPDTSTRFTIDGVISEDMSGIVVAVHLTDTTTNKQIWGDTHRFGFEAAQLSTSQEEVAYSIAVKTSGAHGVIAKILSRESRTIQPADLGAYEAILRFYEYANTGILLALYSVKYHDYIMLQLR